MDDIILVAKNKEELKKKHDKFRKIGMKLSQHCNNCKQLEVNYREKE